MRNLIFITFFLILINCTSSKKTYWCGDHPCINKAEQKSYFKKNMIIEVKELNKKDKKEISKIKKITQQARVNEKKRIKSEKELAKQARLDEKRKIKEQKELAKQARLDEKRKIKEQKELAKQARLEEKKGKTNKVIKSLENKKYVDKDKIAADTGSVNVEVATSSFKKLVEKIANQNKHKPYPDINNVPE